MVVDKTTTGARIPQEPGLNNNNSQVQVECSGWSDIRSGDNMLQIYFVEGIGLGKGMQLGLGLDISFWSNHHKRK